MYFYLVLCLFSGTYKIIFCISGIGLLTACVRHAKGVHQHGAERSAAPKR
ncbi:MAG: hypothetical protein RML94_11250 [Bacteroidia bacterium]|nr:hypothetical protein [Bacteroidia bacterium]